MYEQVIIAGFGGQGILFAGQLLAYSSMEHGGEASWLPSYGPEMRGGTANCMVVVSSERIRSPYIVKADSVIAMNKPSLEKFEPRLREGGTLLVNHDMIDRPPTRSDVRWSGVAANSVALELGAAQVVNMVMLGAYLGVTDILPMETVIGALPHVVSARRQHLIDLNARALNMGYELVREGAAR